MNALESEYSFLAPTWKLPTIATPSLYSRTYGSSFLTHEPTYDLDWILWKNTLYNSRPIPSYIISSRSNYDYTMPTNQQRPTLPAISSQQEQQQQYYQVPNERPKLSQSFQHQPANNAPQHKLNINESQTFETNVNRQTTYSTPAPSSRSQASTQQRRVQITDRNNHQPTSTAINNHTSGRNSYNSNHNQTKSKSSGTNQENRFGYTGNNFNIHEYLYGLSAPDPGSYVDAFRQHQRRLQDEKLTRRYVLNDYRNFVQNGGFGPIFGNTDHRTFTEKVNKQDRRKVYSKAVRETNHNKIETQRQSQTSYSQQRNPTSSTPRYQRVRTNPYSSNFQLT